MTNPVQQSTTNPSTPAVSAVAVKSKPTASGNFLLEPKQPSEWPKREPLVKLPMWNRKDSFIEKFLDHKVVIAHCPTGSGKSTILPSIAAMNLHPKAGRVCCTQIRRATTQAVCRNTKEIWGIEEESEVVGFRHGTEKSESRSCNKLLDEAHSGSTDIELILARVLPRINKVPHFRLVLMSATLNVDSLNRRLLDAGIPPKDIGVFLMEERTNPLSLHCLPQELLRDRDNMELALSMIIKLHHEYRNGYQGSPQSKTGPILVFVPGKAGDRDPDSSRFGELANFNKGRKHEEDHMQWSISG